MGTSTCLKTAEALPPFHHPSPANDGRLIFQLRRGVLGIDQRKRLLLEARLRLQFDQSDFGIVSDGIVIAVADDPLDAEHLPRVGGQVMPSQDYFLMGPHIAMSGGHTQFFGNERSSGLGSGASATGPDPLLPKTGPPLEAQEILNSAKLRIRKGHAISQ